MRGLGDLLVTAAGGETGEAAALAWRRPRIVGGNDLRYNLEVTLEKA
jgi:hypothetical protein